MRFNVFLPTLFAVATLTGCTASKPEMMGNLHHELDMTSF